MARERCGLPWEAVVVFAGDFTAIADDATAFVVVVAGGVLVFVDDPAPAPEAGVAPADDA